MNKDFISKVLEIVAQIPNGKVTTYGAIAEKCGIKSSARMVGWVLSASAEETDLPFHRVVNRNGELTGKYHFLTPTLMKELLESEGVEFIGEKVKMNSYFWEPK